MIIIPKINSDINEIPTRELKTKETLVNIKGREISIEELKTIFNVNELFVSGMIKGEYKLKFFDENIYILSSSKEGINNAYISLINIFKYNDIFNNFILKDKPRYDHRELMIDVARNFFDVSELKKIIYEAYKIKINKIHLHLSDDQGYRLESKKYPLLNEVGDKKFYTENEIKDLVNFTSSLGIELIPGLDIPGHTSAIINAYPELGCNKIAVSVDKGYVGNSSSLDIGSNNTYEFLYNLFDEVMDLFPSKYIHIGCDEVDTNTWSKNNTCKEFMKENDIKSINELEAFFINSISSHLFKNGKEVICFNEACKLKGLNERIIIQNWCDYPFDNSTRKENNNDRKFIASSTLTNYFDYPYYLVPLKYTYDFIPNIKHKGINNIKGTSCHIWTEVIDNNELLEHNLFPRLYAYAENAWCDNKNYNDFLKRLEIYLSSLDRINYAHINEANISESDSTKLIVDYFTKRMQMIGNNKYSLDMMLNGLKITLDLIKNNQGEKSLEVIKKLLLK